MTKSFKLKAAAAVVSACAALFASVPANAYVYAVSKLEVKNLDIGIFKAGTNTPDVGGATNYTFNLNNSASFTPPFGATLSDTSLGLSTTCSGVAGGATSCGTPSGTPLSPILDAKVANAPGLSSARAEDDFSVLGANASQSYSNADSQITTAKLVQNVPTSSVQIAESLLNTNGVAKANTEVKSTTTLALTFNTISTFDLTISFDALLKLFAEVTDPVNGLYTAQASSSVIFSLTQNSVAGEDRVWTWEPNGRATDCEGSDDILATGSTCSVTNGLSGGGVVRDLNNSRSISAPGISSNAAFGAGFQSFGLLIEDLVAGTYSLSLTATTTTLTDRTYLPEPGSLALVGLALAGLGVVGKRRSRKQ